MGLEVWVYEEWVEWVVPEGGVWIDGVNEDNERGPSEEGMT